MKLYFHGLEVTVTYTPPIKGKRTGHPDTWTDDEGDAIEVHDFELDDAGEFEAWWLSLDHFSADGIDKRDVLGELRKHDDELCELARDEHARGSEE